MNPPNELFEVSATYRLIALSLSLCVSAGYLWRFAIGHSDGSERWQGLTAFGAALVLCLTAVDGLNLAQQAVSNDGRVAGSVAILAIATGLTWVHFSLWRIPRQILRRSVTGWLVLISSLGLVGWSYHRFYERLYPLSNKPLLLISTPGEKKEVYEFVAVTNQNRPIRVYRMVDDEPNLVDDDLAIGLNFTDSVIQRAPANAAANCHGWVFLDSQFLISGEAVQQILDDNEYEIVVEPNAGDVIIHRDEDRKIVHSGLVRGVLNDGTVIIESKWGIEGTFLHTPEGTPYSTNFEYYRLPHSDHRVRIVPVDEVSWDD